MEFSQVKAVGQDQDVIVVTELCRGTLVALQSLLHAQLMTRLRRKLARASFEATKTPQRGGDL